MEMGILILFAGGAVLGLVWLMLPRILVKALRATRTLATSQKDPPRERVELTARILEAFDDGVQLILCNSRGRWQEEITARDAKWRPVILEGAGIGFGILTSTGHRRWKSVTRELGAESEAMRSFFCRGAGIWAAKRFGRDLDRVFAATKSLTQQDRNECIEGYGFKFGFFEFIEDRRNIAHLFTIPGTHRRAAFQGVGRALYYLFLNNRRGLFEVVCDLAPDHDGDAMEGAGFAAALVHCDDLRRAINFARAVPYEWRAQVHLGMTLALRERAELDPNYFRVCMAQLPMTSVAAIEEAIGLAEQSHRAICRPHPEGGYWVWRDRLMARLHEGSIWEPVHADAISDSSQTTRGTGIKKGNSE